MKYDNIIISGWPVSGSSTIALMIANLLNYRYVYSGGVFKYLTERIFGSRSAENIVKFEETYGTFWDQIWEAYAQFLLTHEKNLVMEGKLTGFLYQGDDAYKIMLTALWSSRVKRARSDARGNIGEAIDARDEKLKSRWSNDFGVNIFDKNLITERFHAHIDSTDLSIAETLKVTVEQLRQNDFPLSLTEGQAKTLESDYWEKGKKHFIEQLQLAGLYISDAEVIAAWKHNFSNKLAEFPEEFVNALSE